MSLSDLKLSTDPEFQCKGTVPLKNGVLTCGCHVRAEAPDPVTHRDLPGFDSMSNKSLQRLIIKLNMKSGVNNCSTNRRGGGGGGGGRGLGESARSSNIVTWGDFELELGSASYS